MVESGEGVTKFAGKLVHQEIVEGQAEVEERKSISGSN